MQKVCSCEFGGVELSYRRPLFINSGDKFYPRTVEHCVVLLVKIYGMQRFIRQYDPLSLRCHWDKCRNIRIELVYIHYGLKFLPRDPEQVIICSIHSKVGETLGSGVICVSVLSMVVVCFSFV